MKLTRREFLRKLGAVGTLGAMYSLDALISGTLAEAAGEDYRALVCVFLFGGNDGNNTVVPITGEGYASYSAIRGNLAIAGQDLFPLAPPAGIAAYGLHPQLAPLKALWDAGSMAVLLNVGPLAQPLTKTTYNGSALKPDGLFSHFDQQTQWQVTGANSLVRSGWGGRIADRLNRVNGLTPVPMVISIAGDNLYVTGDHTSALVLPSTGGFALHGSTNTPTAYARRAAQDQLLALEREFLLIKEAGDVMTRALANSNIIDPVITSGASTVEGLFAGQNGALAKQLLQVAKLIEARADLGVKRQIFFVSLDGFDTHGNQLNTQSALFAQLAPALKTFYDATVAAWRRLQRHHIYALRFWPHLATQYRGRHRSWLGIASFHHWWCGTRPAILWKIPGTRIGWAGRRRRRRVLDPDGLRGSVRGDARHLVRCLRFRSAAGCAEHQALCSCQSRFHGIALRTRTSQNPGPCS